MGNTCVKLYLVCRVAFLFNLHTHPSMEPENLDIESIMSDRRHAIEETIREVGVSELESLGTKLFSDVTHPWLQEYQDFLEENRGATFYHGKTNEHIHVIYCRSKEKGIWFIPGVGIGILQERGLKALREIVDAGMGR